MPSACQFGAAQRVEKRLRRVENRHRLVARCNAGLHVAVGADEFREPVPVGEALRPAIGAAQEILRVVDLHGVDKIDHSLDDFAQPAASLHARSLLQSAEYHADHHWKHHELNSKMLHNTVSFFQITAFEN